MYNSFMSCFVVSHNSSTLFSRKKCEATLGFREHYSKIPYSLSKGLELISSAM